MRFLSRMFLLLGLLAIHAGPVRAQEMDMGDVDEDDLNVGGDIFNDFNEDIENTQVMEDERFYRYGRFFSFQVSLGLTAFNGNRGDAYQNDHPSYGMGVFYFSDFSNCFGMGFEYSKHHMFVDFPTDSFPEPPGFIQVNILRTYFAYRYYIDTSNLGTAITFANPYFTGRMEYWYVTNKFVDLRNQGDDTGGGLGFGFGGGFDFPIKLKESYVNVQFLVHNVNFHDKHVQSYRPPESNPNGPGYDDLTGNAFTTFAGYVLSW